jgi:nucleoside-diphosphate-sugar epimerase
MKLTKRILITGGSGYIGTNLTTFLENKGFIVGNVDKKIGIYTEHLKLPKKHDLFAIIHLAALAGVAECENPPEQAIRDNIIASMNIFSLAAEHNLPVIVASSQAAQKPMSSVYAFTKYTMEQYAKYYHMVNIKLLRFANVYGGPNYLDTKNSVIACFVQRVLKNEPLVIDGTGVHSRDFIHVDDISNAIYLAMYCRQSCEDPVDIGTGRMIAIKELADMISKNQVYDPENKRAVSTQKINTELAKDLFGFEAKIQVQDYIKDLGI